MKSQRNFIGLAPRTVFCVIAVAIAVNCTPKPQSYHDPQLRGPLRVAILPLANYTDSRDASERVAPILFARVTQIPGVALVDPGAVEAALATEPWLMFDRIPPDLVDRFGATLGVDALLVGSITGYGYRNSGGSQVPHFSVSFRLMQAPGGRVLWSVAHSRDGNDGEWLFGLGRVESVQQLVGYSLEEIAKTFPSTVGLVDIPVERVDEGGL